ncbi:MAG: S8 family serine peptidase, partial [Polyangiales bacterium]
MLFSAHAATLALGILRPYMGRPQILSLRERLDADERSAGRGVCVAFVDLGFYAHPDLLHPRKRIRAFVDVTRERPRARDLYSPRASSWHGMMTACTAVGSGYVSGGRFCGLASEADVVLIKIGDGSYTSIRGE